MACQIKEKGMQLINLIRLVFKKLKRWLFLMALTSSLLGMELVFAVTEYRFERMWPRLEQPWYFASPLGLAITSDGSIYVADSFNDRIQQFTGQGGFIRKWGRQGLEEGQFLSPDDVVVALDGSVYVVESGNSRIQQFNAEGDFIRTWGSFGSGDGQFESPQGIAVAPDDSIYVADTSNYRI